MVRYGILQDWQANAGNPKGRLVLAFFRLMHLLRQSLLTFILFLPLFLLYRLLVEWFMGIELPWKTRIGPGFRVDHGQALVINDGAVFGAGCTVRNSTTIGNKRAAGGGYTRAPIFGDRVDIGANAVIIGPVTIGDDVLIGAGAVVVKDVPAGHIAVGNPARILPRKDLRVG